MRRQFNYRTSKGGPKLTPKNDGKLTYGLDKGLFQFGRFPTFAYQIISTLDNEIFVPAYLEKTLLLKFNFYLFKKSHIMIWQQNNGWAFGDYTLRYVWRANKC